MGILPLLSPGGGRQERITLSLRWTAKGGIIGGMPMPRETFSGIDKADRMQRYQSEAAWQEVHPSSRQPFDFHCFRAMRPGLSALST